MRRAVILWASFVASACGSKEAKKEPAPKAEPPPPEITEQAPPSCPALAPAPKPLPRVDAAERTLAYWLERTPDLDDVLLDVDAIRVMNASLSVDRGADWRGEYDLTASVDTARLQKDVTERLTGLHDKLKKSELLTADGKALPAAEIAALDPAAVATVTFPPPELHVALTEVPLRCGPRVDAMYAKPTTGAINHRFDRNSCSTVHPQEPVQLLATWPNGMHLVRTRYATGWIAGDAKLSPAIPANLRDTFVRGPRVQADEALAVKTTGGVARCPAGALLPSDGKHVRFADASGFHEIAAPEEVRPVQRPLTKRALLTEAFRFLDSPYGWGGGGATGGHDCSSFMMDLFGAFDIHLPRHSSWQAKAGTFSIDMSKMTSETERKLLLDEAVKKGVVLLSFPGHVMLYLGRNEKGTPMVLHALAEYAAACPGGGETLFQIEGIGVSDLELGRGSSRKSLLERITHATVLGKPPGVALAGAAEMRPAAPVSRPAAKACKDSQDVAMFASPRVPNAKQPMRVIVTANRETGPSDLALFAPDGTRVKPTLVRLAGGPPWSIIATVDAPVSGAYTAVLGDGDRIDACKRIGVARKPPKASKEGDPMSATWKVDREWTRATENLYATFVQRLFDFPPDQDVTWPNLSVLTRDPSHNILFDHLQQGEDATLKLEPDCADLPVILRSYFAWKLGLPFAYHTCNRGTSTRAPTCKEEYATNLMTRDALDDKEPVEKLVSTMELEETDGIEEESISDVSAFGMFCRSKAARAVHAASGRTLPEDENTDYYPVPLTREALKPGTIYNDPFGHVMIIASWVPQTATSYGILLAADAQPDGTVGRKRFWRGNFLMTTETKTVGAGFKAFRPVLFDRATKSISLMENKLIRRSRVFAPLSLQQYEGSLDAFYDTMESLVNPRPLEPLSAMSAVVDSLLSQATLRIVSVKNGEDWVKANPGKTMVMPDGEDIFLTTGPWEDFATPSRDFRLLIAIDTVLDFPASVRRAPQRFGLTPAMVDATVKNVEVELDKALRAKSIEYIRSDGSKQTVTLREIADRKAGFEISYNPNDCVEIRWGAPEDSAEAATCKRRAPKDQAKKMAEYRAWFHERRRPAL